MERLRKKTSRAPKGDFAVIEQKTLSPRLRERIQQRVNGRKTGVARAVVVKETGQVIYFRSDWAKNALARRRAANKVAKRSRKRNR